MEGASASRGIFPRLTSCATSSVVDLLAFPALFSKGLDKVTEFLLHQFPVVRRYRSTDFLEVLTAEQVRTATAEYLYLVMQSKDLGKETDAAEEVLLETEWWVLV